jgi:cytochrome c oxidase cbb3-type subunit 3
MSGEEVYGRFCVACHGRSGEGLRYPGMPPFPAVGNPDFLSVASDQFVTETVQRGRPGGRMPAWSEERGGLRPEEIAAVVAHLRILGGVTAPEPDDKPSRWAQGDPAAGYRLFAAHCAGCHGGNGQGAEGPALNNEVLLSSATDTYLVETIKRGRRGTSMAGFERASPVHPALTPEEIEAIVSHIRRWEHSQ